MDHRLGFYVFGISRARRMGIDRVLIHTKFFDILPPPTVHELKTGLQQNTMIMFWQQKAETERKSQVEE